jgi:hypothetical protein
VRLRAADVRKRLAQYYQSKVEPGQLRSRQDRTGHSSISRRLQYPRSPCR